MKIAEFIKVPKSNLRGKVVCFPTDTVYGVGALIDDNLGIEKIYVLKHRDYNKPLAILAPSVESILPYIEYPTADVIDLMKKYWPGALTIIFKKHADLITNINPRHNTIAFRIPNSKVALAILNHFGPMATTSVNLSGSEPLNDLSTIMENFNLQIDYLIEDLEKTSNHSSTIIDATTSPIKIIRQGDIVIN